MEVQIKKEGKTKKFTLIKKWSDVTLEKWIKLIEYEKGSKVKQAQETITQLSNIPKQLINELGINDVALIMSRITELQNKSNTKLVRTITVNGTDYGFHPNLDDITLGEYADLEQFIKLGVEKNMPEIMAILYRPIVERKNKVYTIEAYDGNISIRAEQFKKMSAEQVQASLVFFWALGNELCETLPSVLTQRMKDIQKQL
tara:strand:- start:186 stop:788 length:603 start_codon:yes stop_codon:yes gene_type:complete